MAEIPFSTRSITFTATIAVRRRFSDETDMLETAEEALTYGLVDREYDEPDNGVLISISLGDSHDIPSTEYSEAYNKFFDKIYAAVMGD